MIAPKNRVGLRSMVESPAGRSESLVGKATRIYSKYAQPFEYKHLKIGYKYKLDLEKLTPDYLTTHDLKTKADEFLVCKKGYKSFDLLRRLGAVERVYSCTGLSTENLYGDILNELRKRGYVQIDFNECQSVNLKDLSENISKNGLNEDGRSLLLFRKALASVLTLDNINNHFILNLGLLTPVRLKEKRIANWEIEDMIDSPEDDTVIKFLKKTGALVINKGSARDFLGELLKI